MEPLGPQGLETLNLLCTLSSVLEVKRQGFLPWLPKRCKRRSWENQRIPKIEAPLGLI